jgi:predicted type IV restriction endonuclease
MAFNPTGKAKDMATRQEIETALDSGNLWAAMRNGRFWKCRRNGKTQTWKREPERFSIPVKAGLKSCARVTETDPIGSDGYFLISATDPNGKA